MRGVEIPFQDLLLPGALDIEGAVFGEVLLRGGSVFIRRVRPHTPDYKTGSEEL